MVIDFNGANVFDGYVERWDLLLIVAVAATIGLLAPILPVPQHLLGGALVACGVGAVCIWPRFVVIPLIENSSVASPGWGGAVGAAGAVLILFSGYNAVRASQRQETSGGTPELTNPPRSTL